ncbi:TetR/AcrR family transcriptional regulator [Maricurvus nonylphenolicus]|uniref:TetR/AcrR family transcriptional regulator n=1 Tax=Maricurvus nonylphenolicus TaxID=1008307 RepID=UPI0036F28332
MARPRKSDHTKQQLLDTGTELLINQGYHGTGIKAVLDAVGVPKGSFYNFFASKEAFVKEIIEHYGAEEVQAMAARVEHLSDQPALIQLWCTFAYKVQAWVSEDKACACLLGAMAAEIADASDCCRQTIKGIEQEWVDIIQIAIATAQQEGDIRSDINAAAIAQLLYNSWQGALLHAQITQNPQSLLDHFWTLLSSLITPQGQTTFAQSSLCNRELDHE